MTRASMSVAAALALVWLAACTSTTVDRHAATELATLRTAGYRVVVVPFAVTAPDDGFVADTLAPVGELLALEANRELPMRQRVAEQVHGDVVAWLQQTEFEVVDPWHAATLLSHAGITPARATDPANVRAVAAATGADGVVYGDVRRWNRGYYLVQSVVEVMLHLELIDAVTQRQLFRTDRAETIGSGLTGGPTGYVSAATEPIAGLRGSNLRNLTRAVARHAVADLNGGDLGNQPGPTSPRLALVALAKDRAGPFRAGERIDVIAIGSPDCEVRFDLGRMRTLVPMQQTARDDSGPTPRATYLGHYIVMPEDAAEELPVLCTIERGAARRRVTIRYRWEGTVSLAGGAAVATTAAR